MKHRTSYSESDAPARGLGAFFAVLLCTFASGQPWPQNAFIKVTEGALVTDHEGTLGFGWADYDGDRFLDLLVVNSAEVSYPQVRCSLYHNLGDGTFERVDGSSVVTKTGSYGDALWGDYDNDGLPDVYLPNPDNQSNDLFHNQGAGEFVDLSNEPGRPTTAVDDSFGGAWVDYDNDGWLDLFVVNRGASGDWSSGQDDCLYRNNADGTFTKMSAGSVGSIVADGDPGQTCAWADLDGDGRMECLRGRITVGVLSQVFVFRSDGNGAFGKIAAGSLTTAKGLKFALADFDNDGDLDVFSGGLFSPYELHRNNGAFDFEEVAMAAGLDRADQNWSQSGCWGDVDNDADLDLFIVNYQETNKLYLNNGDGTFASVDAGAPLTDGNRDIDAAWVDYDNDGLLDLFLGNGNGQPQFNFLYRNNLDALGNQNRWLKVKLAGTRSNRSGIGATIRASAAVDGQVLWQMRQLACAGATAGGQQGLLVHFGLGDATKVDTLRIEWPSGIVQELKDVAPNQILTVTEPPRLIPQDAGGFRIQSWINQSFDVQCSTNLTEWVTAATVTNQTGTLVFHDPEVDQHDCRYYRVAAE